MAVQLNHTIVAAHDKRASAHFLAEILGLDPPTPFGPFICVETANGVSLDYMDYADQIEPAHYAFLVTEEEFDDIFARVTGRGLTYWADLATPGNTRSTTTGEASISRTRQVTTWRCSRVRTVHPPCRGLRQGESPSTGPRITGSVSITGGVRGGPGGDARRPTCS